MLRSRLEAGRRYYARQKLTCFMHYSNGTNKCACCGESIYEFLTIDHINNDGAEHRKHTNNYEGVSLYRWLVRNDFPEHFRVLCYNCNLGRAKSKTKTCPHENIINDSWEWEL